MRRRLHLLLIPVAASLCILPLLLNGPSCGHDFDFHLLSWLEAARQISAGNLHPHWAYTPAFGAGEPRFVFYPPLSWTLGALITLLLQRLPHLSTGSAFALAPLLYTWLALCSAGLAMHSLARRYTTGSTALLVATLYLANPYTLFTAYERTAFAELLAATWLPLLLLALLPSASTSSPPPRPVSIPFLALTVALLWLTNAPAAVMGCYALAVLAALRIALLCRERHPLQPALALAGRVVAGTSLGLGLAAFYILPAAFERRWVQISMATIPGMRIADNTLFHHTSDLDHDHVLHTASLIAILLLILTAAALLLAWRTVKSPPLTSTRSAPIRRVPDLLVPDLLVPDLLVVLSILTGIIALLLTPLSSPLWRYLPELSFLQFPWRILAILAPILALAIALALPPVRLRTPILIALALLLPAALTCTAYPSFHQACDPVDTPQGQLAIFQSTTGADPTDEYTPITADNDALQRANPALHLFPGERGSTSESTPGPAPAHFDLNLLQPEQLLLNLRDYPAWQIQRNGAPLSDRVERNDGLIAFNLPAGHSHIDIVYLSTPDRIAGDAISAAALCIFAPVAFFSVRSRRRQVGAEDAALAR